MEGVAYKVASSGGVVLSSAIALNTAYDNNIFNFNMAPCFWVTGALQTSGPANMSGPFSVELGLWHYSPTADTLTLTTTYSDAGFDIGLAVQLDASSNVWVVGYSSNPSVSLSSAVDFAMWEFDPTGTVLSSGPIRRPSYLDGPQNGLNANLTFSTGAIYAATTHQMASGKTALVFLEYDLSGNIEVKESWGNNNGGPDAPDVVMMDPSGNVLIGGYTNGGSGNNVPILWRYGPDGTFLSATSISVPGTNQVRGFAYDSGNLWLATGSTAPYLYTGGTTVYGSTVIASSILARPPAHVITGPDPAFELHEIYAFPNPSKRSQRPTIHVETGVADSVDIHFYDISGHKVHGVTLTNYPAIIDDKSGRGPQYAYEYTWEDNNVGSGVYIYVVTTHKAGYSNLTKISKVAIIK